jgi:hypothetical protein
VTVCSRGRRLGELRDGGLILQNAETGRRTIHEMVRSPHRTVLHATLLLSRCAAIRWLGQCRCWRIWMRT